MFFEKMLIATLLAVLVATAMAGETISCSYDKADNRTKVNVASPDASPP